jgi:hypothetical protein
LLTSVQWTLANTFDLKGWFFSKLDLTVTILFWTVHFLFDKDADIGRRGWTLYVVSFVNQFF